MITESITELFEIDGKPFVPLEQMPVPEWPGVLSDRPLPTLTLKDDDLFLVADTLGNISGCLESDRNASLGLFCADTRFLSRLELQIEGRSPLLLTSTAEKGFILSVLCTNPHIDDRLAADTLGIQRELVLNGGLFEEMEVCNYSTSPVKFQLSLSFDADFVDLFEVRGYGRQRRGQLLRRMEMAHFPEVESLSLAYRGLDGLVMESRLQFLHHRPHLIQGYTAIWNIELDSHEHLKLGYRLEPFTHNQPASRVSSPSTLGQAKAAELIEQQLWREQATQIQTDNASLNQIIHRAEQDVHLLLQTFEQGRALSAGVPWFSTLFGRDAIIAAGQMLMLNPAIARDTLTLLAHYQGKVVDDWREEEPGKILHEIRTGEMARCQEIPHTPYYGTVDATPLWLMLYSEYYSWTDDRETLERLWPNALAAMGWIDANLTGSYVSYARKSKRGLVNQGWKDSGDCIVNRKGQLASGPISLCEVQAYVYAAKLRLSGVARLLGYNELAEKWQTQAWELKSRFNQDFWIEDLDYCALALDGEGKPVDSITSNPGHCLNLGILSPEKAYSVAERLRAPDMFNGWGIRTLSSLSPAYNPMGYHIGSVWPHDNALIALGLRSLGLIDQALEIAGGILDMTRHQPYGRPPELFCGHERLSDNTPVTYPVACSPQAWATGSIFQFLQIMANLVPDAPSNCLRVIDPALPDSLNRLYLKNLRVGTTLLDLEFERVNGATSCRVANKRGNLRVLIEA
uniref:Amylo-alpha-16-glucosidase n=1 Tax=Cyanothece sp. (strain PCC 7425 / ATCC 29141) TaxID=395961 RepID=B8HK49_CYAP4